MIASIRKGKYIRGAIAYNEKKVKQGVAEYLGCNGMFFQSVKGRGDDFIRQLTNLADLNKNVSRPVFHTSLNSPPGQVISGETWMNIARDYMQKMGFGDTPFAIYRHNDRGHDHIHIVSVMVDPQGLRISDSNDRHRSQEALEELSEKYGLQQVTREKFRDRNEEVKISADLGLKSRVALEIESVIGNRNIKSIEQFKSTLELQGISFQLPQENSQKRDGKKKKNGIVFFTIDKKGQQACPGMKGSSFLQDFSFNTISRHLERNSRSQAVESSPVKTITSNERTNQEDNNHRNTIRAKLYSKIKQALLNPGSLQDFTSRLDGEGVNVRTFQNAGGIYGISFEDKESGEVFKASEVDRNLSWNKLKDFFEDIPVSGRELATEGIEDAGAISGQKKEETPGAEKRDTVIEEEPGFSREESFSIPYSGTVMNTGADNTDDNEEERKRKKRRRNSR